MPIKKTYWVFASVVLFTMAPLTAFAVPQRGLLSHRIHSSFSFLDGIIFFSLW
jgi:hypothetical protein